MSGSFVRCYHFCNEDFYNNLIVQKEIIANDNINIPEFKHKHGEHYVKEFVFINKRLNNGNGMFFAWSNPDYKGEIEFDSEGKYYLLELNVPEDICIKTHYENWCSLGMDLYDVDGDIEKADTLCRELFGIKNGLEGSYEAIFEINEQDEIQILMPYIKKDWINSVFKCNNMNK